MKPPPDFSVIFLTHHDIARQKEADVGIRFDGPMCERRVAGTQDAVRFAVDVEFRLECGFDVDVGQDAEAFFLKSFGNVVDGFVECCIECDAESVQEFSF